MPDLLSVIVRQWKLMLVLVFLSILVALLVCLLKPKQYAGIATALPANSALSDKARIFNQNIEALYNELGSPDELDKIEGTAKLDTIYLAAAKDYHLAAHYAIDTAEKNALEKAAKLLQKNTAINRSGYGELRIKVWDQNAQLAATLANALLQKLNEIHQHLQMENNRLVLQRLKEEYELQKQQLAQLDTIGSAKNRLNGTMEQTALISQLQQYRQLINEYELALRTTPNVLLTVEQARPQISADRPNIGQTVLLSFLASLLFSFLLAIYLDSRNQKV